MSIILSLDRAKAKRSLKKRKDFVMRGEYQADITDDGQVIMLHFDYEDQVNIYLEDLLKLYVESL